MTRKEAKELLPIIQAFAEGKTVQYKGKCGIWIDCANDSVILGISKDPSHFRIKLEPKYRPFESQEECGNEMLKHQPFGWIKSIRKQEKVHILRLFTAMDEVFITLSINGGLANNSDCVFNEYTFDDGTPFGIKEE